MLIYNKEFNMSFVFRVIARNPPAVLFVIGAFLMVYGSSTGNQNLTDMGFQAIQWGVGLQVLYLIVRAIKS